MQPSASCQSIRTSSARPPRFSARMSSWRELYNHPDNAAFRKKRPDPNRIFPGDSISPIFFGPAETKLTTLLFRLEENVVQNGLAYRSLLIWTIFRTLTSSSIQAQRTLIWRIKTMVRNLEAGKGFSDTLDLLVVGPDLGRGVACTLSPLGDTPTAMAPLNQFRARRNRDE